MPTNVTDRLLSGNDYSVFVSKQTTKGSIDANPVFTPYRRTEGKGSTTVNYTQSSVVKSTRQGRQQIQDGAEHMAEIGSELNKQSIDDFISAIHGAETIRTVTGTDVAADASGFVSASATPSNMFANVKVGEYIWMSGFANADLNRLYRVTVKTSANDIDTYPAPAATEAAGASVTMTSKKSANGKDQTYYALQTRTTDNSKVGDIDYNTLYDAIINTLSIEVPETGIATCSLSLMAEEKVSGTAAISGQTDAAELTDDAISAYQSIVDWFLDGVSAKGDIKSMSLEVNNNYQADSAAGVKGKRYTFGDIDVSGSIVVRSPISNPFKWRDYYENGTNVELGVHLTHGSGHESVIIITSAKVTENSMPDGSNVVSNSEASFAAQEDTVSKTTVELYRNW